MNTAPESVPTQRPSPSCDGAASALAGAGPAGAGRPLGEQATPADDLLRAALAEDLGLPPGAPLDGERDLTSLHTVPADLMARATLVSKAAGVLAGLEFFARVFHLLGPGVRVLGLVPDGTRLEPGLAVATLRGPARLLLTGERTALNLVQRASGVATCTAEFVAAAPGVRILDTRKTTPALRVVERAAVRAGGGENHRFGLFDELMIKNNHLDLARRPLAELLREARAAVGPRVRITAEARDRAEAEDAVRGGADVVLLDNFQPDALLALCRDLRVLADGLGRAVELEASGGIRLENAGRYARAGLDRLSIGALTHSAPALDLSLRIEREERP
jgi:nicotinate-nucleotide pyrophosphorylase (carboxylating)